MTDLRDEFFNTHDLYASGNDLEMARDENGRLRARVVQPTAEEIVRLRAPMRQAQSPYATGERDPSEIPADIARTVGALGKGAAVGTVGAAGDIAGLARGIGAAIGAEEGERLDAFTRGFDEISQKYGTGAVNEFANLLGDTLGLRLTPEGDEYAAEMVEQGQLAGEFLGLAPAAKAGKAVAGEAARMQRGPLSELGAIGPDVKMPGQVEMDLPEPRLDVNPEAISLSPEQRSASLISDLYEDGADQLEAGGNLYDVASRINARSKAIGDMSEPTPENVDKIGSMLAAETLHAMRKTGNAGEWYRTKVDNAMKIAERVYPEAAQDPNKMNALKFITAITSNGASVPENSKNTFNAFDQYLQTGKMPDIGFGKEGPAMKSAFKLYNSFVEEMGEGDFFKFMSEEFTVRELNEVGKKYGFKVSGENMDTQLPASVIFGPKIGGGFYQNLQGNYTPLTMDRWFMRTWGRLTGSLIVEQTPQAAKKQLDRIRGAVTPEIAEQYGYSHNELLADDILLVELAERATKDYVKSGYKAKTELNKASKNYVEAQKKVLEQPKGGKHRTYMRDAVDNALAKLSAQGVELDRAALQALVWYPEKELYSKLGVGTKKSAPTDYEAEFAIIARERGVDVSDITSN